MTIFKKAQTKTPAPEPVNSIFVARQGIFDLNLNIYAYELLFRNSNVNSAEIVDANQATSILINNSFVEIGIDVIANNKLAFINLTRDYLIGEIPLPFESDKVVLEVLEDIEADPECLLGLQEFVKRGFKIALDDFVVNDKTYGLIDLADIIKIDILAMDESALRQQVEILKEFPVKLLAEKIETEEQFCLCKELGFVYFQGYFFCKPKIIQGKELPVNQIKMLEVVAKLQDPDCDFSELEEIISNDVSISYKLLKIINSPFYARINKVNSIKEALVIIGLETLKNWITLLSFSMIGDKPEELIKLSLIRAKMCENLATNFHVDKKSAFTIGLFSLLDALMDQSIEVLVGDLPLSEEIVSALTTSEGALGGLLKVVTAYEKGDWSQIPEKIQASVDFSKIYIDAVDWADDLSSRVK